MEALKKELAKKDEIIATLEEELESLRSEKYIKVNVKQKQKKRATDAKAKTAEELFVYENNSILWSRSMN